MSGNSEHHVVVLGASEKKERHSNQAVNMLIHEGYKVTPVNPAGGEIHGIKCVPDLASVEKPVDTLTMYVGPARSSMMIEEIMTLGPERIIFNPGAENYDLESACAENDIITVDACTLVLVRTGQF